MPDHDHDGISQEDLIELFGAIRNCADLVEDGHAKLLDEGIICAQTALPPSEGGQTWLDIPARVSSTPGDNPQPTMT